MPSLSARAPTKASSIRNATTLLAELKLMMSLAALGKGKLELLVMVPYIKDCLSALSPPDRFSIISHGASPDLLGYLNLSLLGVHDVGASHKIGSEILLRVFPLLNSPLALS